MQYHSLSCFSSAYIVPNRFKYLSLPSLISLVLSYSKAADMNGNMTNGITIMTDNDNDMISAVESVGLAATLSTVPNVISR